MIFGLRVGAEVLVFERECYRLGGDDHSLVQVMRIVRFVVLFPNGPRS